MRYKRPWKCLRCFGLHWSEDEVAACRALARALTPDEIRQALEVAEQVEYCADAANPQKEG